MRISSPPITESCFYGIDTPKREQLLAAKYNISGMAEYIGVDSLAFISDNGIYHSVCGTERDANEPQYCDACFTRNYPIRLTDRDTEQHPNLLALLDEQT